MHMTLPGALPAFLRTVGVATLLLLAVFLVDGVTRSQPVAEAVGGFVGDVVVGGLENPTDFAFAPDGRIFVAQRFLGSAPSTGTVRVIKNGAVLPTPFITLAVNSRGERGIVGLALDPNFAVNNYVYIYYTLELNAADPDGRKASRLIRVTAAGDVAQSGSEVVLLGSVLPDAAHNYTCELYPAGTDCLPADSPYHVGGGMRFGIDGKLFLSIGDSAQYGFGTPLRAQNLDKMSGKILRVNPNGTAPTDNPFYNGNVNANRSKVWQYGFRNPFRWGFWPGTNTPMVGDVGTDRWEEIDTGPPGANFGWPCYEGNELAVEPIYLTDAVCVALYASGSAIPPLYTYPRGSGAAIIGGLFYWGTSNYPPEYVGRFFFADYISDTMSAIDPITKNVVMVLSQARGAVDWEYGPDGNLWYLAGADGFEEVRRLRWDTGNLPPIAVASGVPTAGLAPLNVQFSSAGSYEPEGQALTFGWQFGDGASSSLPNPAHTYVANGNYTAVLRVTDPGGAFAEATVPITVGNAPPVPKILGPINGSVYTSGDTIELIGAGTDLEDGVLAPSSLAWKVFLVHCAPSNVCHEHDYLTASGVYVTFTAPTHSIEGGDYFFARAELTATDSTSLTGTVSRIFGPDVNADRCMDAYLPLQTYAPPFTLFASTHVLSGNVVGNHFEQLQTEDPIVRTSVNWAQTFSPTGTAGSETSLTVLAVPITVAQAGTYGFVFDTDLYAQLSAVSDASASAMSVVFGGVLSGGGAVIGEVEVLHFAQATDTPSGGTSPVTYTRVAHPLAFSRPLAPGAYTLFIIPVLSATGTTPGGVVTTGRSEGWIGAINRASTLCRLRAPASSAAPFGYTAEAPGVAGTLPATLAALATEAGRYAQQAVDAGGESPQAGSPELPALGFPVTGLLTGMPAR